jgi:predicted kinase
VHSPSEDRRLWNAIHEASARLLSDGVGLILDATNLIEAHRKPVYELSDRTGARLVIVEVTAAERVVASRLTERERVESARGGSTDWYDLYRSMAAARQPVSREHLIIDSSDPDSYEAGFWRVVEACRREPAGERTGGRP